MSKAVIILSLLLSLAGCAAVSATSTATSENVERGAQIFRQGLKDTPPCLTCHQVVKGQIGFSIGPNLAGVGERAGTRIAGMAAAEYLRQSILDPHRYVVPGYRDIMFPDYRNHLTEQNLEDLIVYLLTL